MPPRVEEVLLARVAETTSVEKPQLTDNFFELGGDSLGAVALTEAMETEFGAEFPLETLFEAKTLSDVLDAYVLLIGANGG